MTERKLSPALLLLFEMLLAAFPVFVPIFYITALSHTLLHIFELIVCKIIANPIRIDFCKLWVRLVADERLLYVSGVFVPLTLDAICLACNGKLCALGDPGDSLVFFFSAGTAGEYAIYCVYLSLVGAGFSWTLHLKSLQYFAPQLHGDLVLPRKQRRHLSSP